ncbi:MAG TPA: hypothetical protein VID27_21355, partial [Blastocatellia bacterium]
MKGNRTINLRLTPQGRMIYGISAVLFALSLTVSASTPAAQTTKTPATQRGTVAGTLTLDGKAITLGYIYAQRREARPSDAERFKLKDDETLDAGVIDLIATNLPLTEKTINDLISDRYRGSNTTRGIWLIIDSSQKHDLVRNFLLQSGVVAGGAGTSMVMSSGDARIEHGRFSGKLECKIEEVTTLRMYSFTFDALLKHLPFEAPVKSAISPDQFVKDFQKIMPGQWKIERWWADNGHTTTGTLTVAEKFDGEEFRGVLHLISSTGVTVDEDVIITRQGTKIHFEGSVAPGTKWI